MFANPNPYPTSLNALDIRRRLGRSNWAAPAPFGPDGWSFMNLDGDDWIHASIARDTMPTYTDLKMLHDAVFGDGWAYQVFAPPSEHVNIHEHALHLWGRLDGKPALPNFTEGSGSV